MLNLLLHKPFQFSPINLHNCCPSESKCSILSYALHQNLVPPAFGIPVKNGKEEAVLKKKPLSLLQPRPQGFSLKKWKGPRDEVELVVLGVCNSTVHIGIWTNLGLFFFSVTGWPLFSYLRLQLRQCNKE